MRRALHTAGIVVVFGLACVAAWLYSIVEEV